MKCSGIFKRKGPNGAVTTTRGVSCNKERSRVANPTSTATATIAAAGDTAGTEPVYANTPRTSSSTTTAAKPDVAGFVTKNDSKVSSEGTFET